MKAKLLARQGLSEQDVRDKLAARAAARAERDWAKADAVRDELLALRVQLMDTPTGTDWRPIYEADE